MYRDRQRTKAMTKGYFGIGIYHVKREVNVGTLWRSAFIFGAHFIFTIGQRYHKQSSDTPVSWRHIPLWHFATLDQLYESAPYNCELIAIERTPASKDIIGFQHPDRAIYLLGPEDGSLPDTVPARHVIQIPGPYCLNVATAGAIVMYDRLIKAR